MTLRALIAGSVVVAFGVLTAVMLGEYEFRGALPFVSGPLAGLVLAEIFVGVGQVRGRVPAAAVAVVAGLSLAWAGWIDANRGVEPYPTGAALAAGLAAAAAAVRVLPRRRRPSRAMVNGSETRTRSHPE